MIIIVHAFTNMKQQKILFTTINIFILQDKQTSKLRHLEDITKYVQNDYLEPNQGVHGISLNSRVRWSTGAECEFQLYHLLYIILWASLFI